MVHVETHTLSFLEETSLRCSPLSFGEDILDLSLDVVGVHTIVSGIFAKTEVSVCGGELNQTESSTMATVVSCSPSAFADPRVEL